MTAPDSPQPATEAVVVRVSLGRVVYSSERMTLAEAQDVTSDLRDQLRRIGSSHLLVQFHADGFPELYLRASRITDIGIRSVSAGRSQLGRGSSARHAGDGIRWTPRLLNRADVTGRVIG